ncbi:MAG: cold-shock protein [Syntrophales bacterium]
MPTGRIKWFNQQIGAGFIRSDKGENVFFRCGAIDRNNRKAIRPDQCVSFEIAKNLRSIAQTAARVKTV